MTNQVVVQLVRDLKKASSKNDAPIWSKIAEFAQKPSSARRTINVYRINQITKENEVVIFPGKVLGTGNISHKITLCAFAISNSAVSKILKDGGKIISFNEIIKKFPTGKGVKLLG